MNLKKLHYFSGLTITVFIVLHLFNHLYGLMGAEAHIEMMNSLRPIYRNIFIESLLLLAVLVQIISGIKLFISKRKGASTFFEKIQLWSGMYLAFFFVIHLSAILSGRFILDLDTNFYFGVAGLNSFPFNLFFVPYYALAIISFFGHIAAIHAQKMKRNLAGLSPRKQSVVILALGILLSFVILYGLTNGFTGVEIPEEYGVLIGRRMG